MLEKIEKQSFDIAVYDEASETNLIQMPLEAVMSPSHIESLLIKIGQEQGSRVQKEEEREWGVYSATRNAMNDSRAETRATGQTSFTFTREELEAAGVTEREANAYYNGIKADRSSYVSERFVATASPGEAEAMIAELGEITGDEAAEAEQTIKDVRRELAAKEKAFIGDGNGAANNAVDWMLEHDEDVQAAAGLGETERFSLLDNKYDVQRVSPANRKYLSEDELRSLQDQFPDKGDFNAEGQSEQFGTYGEALVRTVRDLEETYGPTGRMFSVVNQLFKGKGLPRSTIAILQIPPDAIQAQNNYANALSRRQGQEALRPTTTKVQGDIDTAKNALTKDFADSLVPTQDGTYSVQEQIAEAIEVVAKDYLHLNGGTAKEAVEHGVNTFLAQWKFVNTRPNSTIRMAADAPYTEGDIKRGANEVHTMIGGGEFPLASTLVLKPNQEISDSDEAYDTYVSREGYLRTLPTDETRVGLFDRHGTPVYYVDGDDVFSVNITLKELNELGQRAPMANPPTTSREAISAVHYQGETDFDNQVWFQGVIERIRSERTRSELFFDFDSESLTPPLGFTEELGESE
jgi:hypothetical protein